MEDLNMENFLSQLDLMFKDNADAIAVVTDGSELTYADLDKLANAIAHALLSRGVGQGQVVGVFLNSRVHAIASIIAILRIGCAYLPLDPVYPKTRLEYMTENSATTILITDNNELDHVSTAKLHFDDVDIKQTTRPDTENTLYGLAYIIYTSGSTGLPKGVMMRRDVLNNLINWQNKQYTDKIQLRTAQFSSLSFDVSFQEIFSTFCMGGALYLIEEHIKRDFKSLLSFINEHAIERLFMPYIAVLNLIQWACRLKQYPSSLVQLITAGEQLLIGDELREFFTHCPKAKLYNQYGPSESHVVTEYILPENIDEWHDVPPIGKAIDKAKIFLLNENKQVVKQGEVGEIYIGGDVLAAGYINNDKETHERFLDLEISNKKYHVYKTGDLALEDEDGNIHYKDRVDNQVKINGYRVEISEIEAALLKHKLISAAAVSAFDKAAGQRELVGFVVLSGTINTSDIQSWMLQSLPAYMVPRKLIIVDKLDKTPSGKINRKSMLEKYCPLENTSSVHANEDITESLLKIISQELGGIQCKGEDNLNELGMDSLGANRIVGRFYDDLSLDVPAYRLFQHKDINSLIEQINNSTDTINLQSLRKDVSNSSTVNDIAIIGMSLSVPGADNLDEFWDNLVNDIESVHYFNESKGDDHVNARGIMYHPTDFDAGFFKITPAEAEFIDPQQRVMLEQAWHALEDACCIPDQFNGRIGVYCGVGNNTYYLNNVLKNPQKLNEFGALQAMVANEKDYTATRISYKLNLKGPSVNILTACSTSLVSVCEAVEGLRTGACDIALAGGAAITFPQQQPYEYQEGGIFSKDGHTRTFDKNSSGTVFSDGAGMVVLKRLDYAINDGDKIYAVIKGAAINNDGADKGSFSAPSIEGQKNVILSAQLNANISAEDIGYVEAHGTATPLGDPIEVEALGEAFRVSTNKKQYCGLGSVKSNLGHLTAAAGVVGLIKSALAVKNNYIPTTINYSTPNDALDIKNSPFFVADKGRKWSEKNKKRIAGISSFGIGGTNAHVIIESCEQQIDTTNKDSALKSPVCISAKNEAALLDYLRCYCDYFTNNPDIDLMNVAYSSQHCRQAFNYRASIVASDVKNASQQTSKKIRILQGKKPWRYKNIVFLFPGQGTQTINMGRFLYEHNNSYRKHFEECADVLLINHQLDIKTVIFNDKNALNETVNAQPAIFTISYALAQVLQDAGIKPNYTFGHSIGELVSAAIAGVFDLQTAIKVVITRARVMQAQPPGDMIAVTTSADVLENYTNSDVVIAADNTPQVCTLSGPGDAISKVMKNLQADNIECKLLHTSHAFHSPLMAAAEGAFVEALKNVALSKPTIPFISCVTGDWITNEQATDIKYWARQIVSAVQFRKGAETISQLENTMLVEVGARQVLSGLCLQNLSEKEDIHYCQMMPKPGIEEEEMLGLATAFGNLWENGADVDWSIINGAVAYQRVSIPNYPFQRKSYFIDSQDSISAGVIPQNVPATIENNLVNAFNIEQQQMFTTENNIQSSANMNNLLIEKIKLLFSDASGLELDDADINANFFELGLDSLFLTQASLQLKKEFKVSISFRQLLNDCNTLAKLTDYLKSEGVTVDTPEAFIPVNVPQTDPSVTNPVTTLQTATIPAGNSNIDGSGLTGLFTQQMQLINNQMQILSQALSSSGQVMAGPVTTENTKSQPSSTDVSQSKDNDESRKMPFGASVRINVKRSNELDEIQQKHLNEIIERYNEKLKKSKKFAQDNRKQLADPRVVSGFRNPLKEIIYPVVVERSKGAYLWDIDGNKYIDITCGFGSNFFGNGAEFIRNAVAKQLETGYEIGPQNPMVSEVSRMFCEQTKSDRVAFCNTGSEAVLGAIRLARTVTAKDTIVMFEHDYHGINDEVIVSRGRKGKSIAAAAGIPVDSVSNTIILDYGDEKSLDYIKENADEIAAVLIEPVQSRDPELQPREFLQKLRNICTEGDMAFIFDEVITGFRIHPNGAQGYYGIQSDIATYGKIIGGGMPIGVIAGKHKFLDALDGGQWQFGDDSAPEVGVTYFAGTFVRHPLALAAAKAVLLHLKNNPDIQQKMNDKATSMVSEINNYCKSVGAAVKLPNCGSLFKIKIPQEIPYEELIYVLLREKGIHIWDARPCFITTAHSDEDIQYFINAFKQSVDEMQNMGFLPQEKSISSSTLKNLDTNNPPISGAKLGKKPNGDPAWFVEDSDRPGKYKMLSDN